MKKKEKVMWKIAIVAALLIVVGIILFSSGPNKTNATSNNGNSVSGNDNVIIRGMAFTPTPLTVSVGSTVTWTNMEESTTHTVTSDTGTELNSGQIKPGQTYSHTFTVAGRYDYHCSIHPYMKGTIIVQ